MSWIKQFVADFRAEVHRKADRLRIVTWAEQEQMRAVGFREDDIRRRGELPLAWANLLDALVGIDYRRGDDTPA